MKVLNGIKSVFDKVLAVLGTICLAIMTVMTTYQVITRYFFSAPSAIVGSGTPPTAAVRRTVSGSSV